MSSFSNLSITLPTPQLILQPFRLFTYITSHSPILPLLHLRHSPFSNPSFASPTSQDFHLPHLAIRPCFQIFQGCSDAKERMERGKQREATAPIQSLVKLQPWSLRLQEGPALGQNTLMMMMMMITIQSDSEQACKN